MRPCSITSRSVTPPVFRAVRRLPTLRGLACALACLMALPLCLPFAQAARADAPPAHSALATVLQIQQMEAQAKAHPASLVASPASRLANTPYVAPRVSALPFVPAPVSAASLPRIALPPRPASPTLLDEVGHSLYPTSASSAKAWKQELAGGHLSKSRRVLLHLWLGEWELSQQEQPRLANEHFRTAQHLTSIREPLHGLAAYDAAMTWFYRGAYEEATAQFHRLLMPKTAFRGYDRSNCALWYRHAAACAGYHAQRAALGIPEPTSLDPLCGAAALAACLRSLGLPSGLHSVLAVCRVSGRGSNVGDIIKAGQTLHLQAQPLTADDAGLKLLPKPLVAYVEHDHFVAVTQANAAGVTYLCSDCGPWPGGAVHLTWKQWHALEATIYISVTKPASAAGRRVREALSSFPAPEALPGSKPMQLAYNGSLSSLHLSFRPHLPFLPSALHGHIVRYTGGLYAACGLTEDALQCLIDAQCCPLDSFPAVSPFGDLAGDPVNLANGQEEYSPPTDLTVYNPHGPSISWGRTYQSLRTSAYESDDFGVGWSQPYNISITDNTASAGYMKGQVHPGASQSSVVAPNGTDQPATGLQWDIVRNGSTVATSSTPNGWSVYYDTYSGGQLNVTAPSTASVGTNYEVRSTASGYFDVVTTSSIPQGETLRIPTTGTDSPTTGLIWDIVQSGTTIATSANTHGWQVKTQQLGMTLDVQPPFGAPLGSGYEVRFLFQLAPGGVGIPVPPTSTLWRQT